MRTRIKSGCGVMVFHCISRIVGQQHLLEADGNREVFRAMMWKQADFCGVEVLTYCLLSNHIHILVRVDPERSENLSDEEIMRRIRVLYGKDSGDVSWVEEEYEESGELCEHTRDRFLRRMGDVSEFMKELKQRFSIYYNHQHERFGTLWAARFKSVVVEDDSDALRVVGAYIDLNPVRAGIVEDPKEYPFCGYADALAGNRRCRSGIGQLGGGRNWKEQARHYRLILYCKGASDVSSSKSTIDKEAALKVVREGGRLPLAELLRLRVRYLSDGLVIGSEGFVERIFSEYRDMFGAKRQDGSRTMRGGEWGGLKTMRNLQRHPIRKPEPR